MKIYSIYDRITGNYAEPFTAINKEAAIRRFNYVMSHSQMVAKDCQLFQLGEFTIETGLLTSDIVYICDFGGLDDEE